jgi:P-type Ca2+ transporter type 2A
VSLSILVVIEMFNAMNALSSSESLITMPLWKNMKLIYAIALSMALHFAILYTPFLQGLFSIVPINWAEWQAVLLLSAPVIIIDEGLKFLERRIYVRPADMKVRMGKVEANGVMMGNVEANGKVKHS